MAAGSIRWQWLAVGAIVLAAAVLRALMFSIYDISHADELMQYLEQGNRLATGHGIVPWEVRYGARNALIPQMLAGPLWLGHALWPGTLGAVWLARGVYAGLCAAMTLVAAWRIGVVIGRVHALVALLAAAVWWEGVVFNDLLLSESLSAPLLLLAAPAMIAPGASRKALVVAGGLLGLAVLVRFQMALFGAVLALAALRLDGRRWLWVIAGGVAALALGAASDVAGGHAPYAWMWHNLAMNVGAQNRAARFGAAPWWAYLTMTLADMGPAAPFVLAGAAWGAIRLPAMRPLGWAAVAHLAAHSMIAHKEFRFVWASEQTFVLLAAVASAEIAARVGGRRGLFAAVAGWVALSAVADAASGGAASMRGGGAIPRLGGLAAARGATCGIILPDAWRAHLVPALLPREVPLVIAPEMRGGLPADVAGAGNAAVLPAAPDNAGWAQVRCIAMPVGRACLFVRPGACVAAPGRSYQATLARADL